MDLGEAKRLFYELIKLEARFRSGDMTVDRHRQEAAQALHREIVRLNFANEREQIVFVFECGHILDEKLFHALRAVRTVGPLLGDTWMCYSSDRVDPNTFRDWKRLDMAAAKSFYSEHLNEG